MCMCVCFWKGDSYHWFETTNLWFSLDLCSSTFTKKKKKWSDRRSNKSCTYFQKQPTQPQRFFIPLCILTKQQRARGGEVLVRCWWSYPPLFPSLILNHYHPHNLSHLLFYRCLSLLACGYFKLILASCCFFSELWTTNQSIIGNQWYRWDEYTSFSFQQSLTSHLRKSESLRL